MRCYKELPSDFIRDHNFQPKSFNQGTVNIPLMINIKFPDALYLRCCIFKANFQ